MGEQRPVGGRQEHDAGIGQGRDHELDDLLDRIEEEIETLGEASPELIDRFQAFCEAHGEKADRIGRFLR